MIELFHDRIQYIRTSFIDDFSIGHRCRLIRQICAKSNRYFFYIFFSFSRSVTDLSVRNFAETHSWCGGFYSIANDRGVYAIQGNIAHTPKRISKIEHIRLSNQHSTTTCIPESKKIERENYDFPPFPDRSVRRVRDFDARHVRTSNL